MTSHAWHVDRLSMHRRSARNGYRDPARPVGCAPAAASVHLVAHVSIPRFARGRRRRLAWELALVFIGGGGSGCSLTRPVLTLLKSLSAPVGFQSPLMIPLPHDPLPSGGPPGPPNPASASLLRPAVPGLRPTVGPDRPRWFPGPIDAASVAADSAAGLVCAATETDVIVPGNAGGPVRRLPRSRNRGGRAASCRPRTGLCDRREEGTTAAASDNLAIARRPARTPSGHSPDLRHAG